MHIGNHSYVRRTDIPQINPQEDKDIDLGNDVTFSGCNVCREAYLFSLKSGVINVVARGNSHSATPNSPGWLDVYENRLSNINVLISPNPATENIELSFDSKSLVSITVSSINGTEIATFKNVYQKLTVNVSEWNNGMYFIKLIDDKQNIVVKKFLKE